jgi:hypothetical protein
MLLTPDSAGTPKSDASNRTTIVTVSIGRAEHEVPIGDGLAIGAISPIFGDLFGLPTDVRS